MKKLIFLLIFFAVTQELIAQDKYKGGNGDGYASFTSDQMVVSLKHNNLKELVIYPNPTKDEISIVYPKSERGTLVIVNSHGKTVMKSDSFQDKINLLHLKPGIYILKFGVISRKLIKK